MESDVEEPPVTNLSDSEDKSLVHIIEPVSECTAGADQIATQQENDQDTIGHVAIKIEENTSETAHSTEHKAADQELEMSAVSMADVKDLCPDVKLENARDLKIIKSENDDHSLTSVMSNTPCVLKRTAKNELITANGGIILNDEPPSFLETKPKDPGTNANESLEDSDSELVQTAYPRPIVLVTGDGLGEKNVIKYVNKLKTVEIKGRKRSRNALIVHPKRSRGEKVVKLQTIVNTEPVEMAQQRCRASLKRLAPRGIAIKQEPVSPSQTVVIKAENGDIIVKEEPLDVPDSTAAMRHVAQNPFLNTVAVKSEDGNIVVKQEPTVKKEPGTPVVYSHKSWGGVGSCGPSDESQQITTTVSLKQRQVEGVADQNDNVVMCIKCKETFTNMAKLNDHLKKTKHGDVKPYLYSYTRWREMAYQKKREILEACQGKAWVCPTPSHLSFGPVIPEDQLPETVFKCKVCGGIYYNEIQFKIHESKNSCSSRKRLQESLLVQFESKPIDKSLKKLL